MKRWTCLPLAGAGLILSACRHATFGAPSGTAAPAVTSSPCSTANGVGKLTLVLTGQPPMPETTEALVRLESETERSTVRVNAALGTTFELRPGTYRLSISLPGYRAEQRSASIACGAEQALTVTLVKKR